MEWHTENTSVLCCKYKVFNQCQNSFSFSMANSGEETLYKFFKVSLFWIRVVWVNPWNYLWGLTKHTKSLCHKASLRMLQRAFSSLWQSLLLWPSTHSCPSPGPHRLSLCCHCCCFGTAAQLPGAEPASLTYPHTYCGLVPSPKTAMFWKVFNFLLSEKT